jgi:hypothetical protein
MPLLDHFHPPLQGPRRWHGFHHAWTTLIAAQLNLATLPERYFAIPQIRHGPMLNRFEVHVYEHRGQPERRAFIELASPANKGRAESRRAFGARCANYLKDGSGVVVIDVVTSRSANLHEEILTLLDVKSRRPAWKSPTGLYAVAYRPVTVRKKPRVEVWPNVLSLGEVLPVMPLWLALDLCVPVRLEESYLNTCRSLRIPA